MPLCARRRGRDVHQCMRKREGKLLAWRKYIFFGMFGLGGSTESADRSYSVSLRRRDGASDFLPIPWRRKDAIKAGHGVSAHLGGAAQEPVSQGGVLDKGFERSSWAYFFSKSQICRKPIISRKSLKAYSGASTGLSCACEA